MKNNENGAAPLIETMIAMSVTFVLVSLFFLSVNNLYTIYDRPDVDLQAKSLTLSEHLLSSSGQTTGENIQWTAGDLGEVDVFGLATNPLLSYGTFSKDTNGQIQVISSYNAPGVGAPNLLSSCFLAGTKILMGDGSQKNIEDVCVGDFVRSYDTKTGIISKKPVITVFHHTPDEMPDYYLIINNYLRVTPNHQLYRNGQWTTFDTIQVGDIINQVYISSVEKVYKRVPTYNLEIEQNHNYFVQFFNNSLVVHNDEITLPDFNWQPWVLTSKAGYPTDTNIAPYGGGYYTEYTSLGSNNYLYEIKSTQPSLYTILDSKKLENLQYTPYGVVKTGLGLDTRLDKEYNFNITIINETGGNYTYGASYDTATSIVSATQNVLIYHIPLTQGTSTIIPPWYEHGQITVRVFLGGSPPFDRPCRPSPANGSVNVNISTPNLGWLSWTGCGPGVTYDVFFGKTSSPSIVSHNQLVTSYSNDQIKAFLGLNVNEYIPFSTTYYWKVIAWDSSHDKRESDLWNFTTEPPYNLPPYQPKAISPLNNSEHISVYADLNWTWNSTDVKPDPNNDIVTYDVYFGTSSSPPQVAFNQSGLLYHPSVVMAYNTHYYWRIVAWDDKGAKTIGPLWNFITRLTANKPPNVPIYEYPSNGSTNVVKDTPLKWSGGDNDLLDNVTYTIYLADNELLLNPKFQKIIGPYLGSVTIFTVTIDATLNWSQIYYWKIIADDTLNQTEGPLWHFTTQQDPEPHQEVRNHPPFEPSAGSPNDPGGTTPIDPDVGVTLRWSGGDPDQKDTVIYTIELWTEREPHQSTNIGPYYNYDTDITFSWNSFLHNFDELILGTTYYWKIIATDNHRDTNEGPTWTFITEGTK